MKIVKTKTIEAKDVSEIPDTLIDFKKREKFHDGKIPDFFVYIQDYAWNAFVSHGNRVYQEVKHEAQGIFVGLYFKDQFGEFVVATAYEEGNGNSQSAFVEMSEECLANISEKCQANGTLMLIWIHTHPNFGVFYSGTDNNCLKTNFYKPYQIGIVVDILRKQHKGFKTKGNGIVEYNDYALFNDEKNSLFSPYDNRKIEIVKKNSEQTDRLTEEVKQLKRDMEYKISEVNQCNEKLQLQEKDIERLKFDLQNKTTDIKQLQESLQGKISEYEQSKKEIQSKEKHIESLNSALNYKTTDLNQLQTNLKSKISEIEQLKEDLQNKTDFIKELEMNLQKKIDEIELLKASNRKKNHLFFWKKY